MRACRGCNVIVATAPLHMHPPAPILRPPAPTTRRRQKHQTTDRGIPKHTTTRQPIAPPGSLRARTRPRASRESLAAKRTPTTERRPSARPHKPTSSASATRRLTCPHSSGARPRQSRQPGVARGRTRLRGPMCEESDIEGKHTGNPERVSFW